MLVFASPVPSAFAGLDALQPRNAQRLSAEEQYFQTLAEEHERAAALARQRLIEARRRQHQQHELEAQLRLQQELATVIQARTPQRSPYHTPTRASFGRTLPSLADVILEFDSGDNDACDLYAERMNRRTQERQKRVEQQAVLRALFEEQRRAQAARVAELQRHRAQEARAEQERRRKAQEEQEARRHLAARAADEEKLRQFFQVLVSAMAEEQGAELERQNAIRRNSVPAQEKPKQAPTTASKSTPASPKVPERAPSPAPSVASDSSDASLNSIAHLQDKYEALRSSFTFPSTLIFAALSSSSPASSPVLAYNSTNAPLHAYEHALTNLLTELDGVDSFGDAHVRDVRRSLARDVEAELEALEAKKRDAWRAQSVKVEVSSPAEAAPVVEATPTPVEAAPAPVEAIPIQVESAPAPVVESTPAPESTSTDSPNPVEWLASRLAQPTELEDDEVKNVRESLLESLTKSAPVPAEIATEPATETEPQVEAVTEAAPTETGAVPKAVEPETEAAPALQAVDAHTSTSEAAETVPVVAELESAITSPELEDAAPSPVESPIASSEPEVESTPESTVAAQPEPEVTTEPESNVAAPSEPTSSAIPQSEPEQATFVQVFPDSDSDAGTDGDLVSELADRKSTSGEEFEML